MPVFFEDRVVGALNVASYSRHTFTADEKILLTAAGREAGFAIAKAESERRLAEREADLQRFFDLSRDMLCVADAADGTILYGNPRVCETLGYDLETLLGMDLADVHPPEPARRGRARRRGDARRTARRLHTAARRPAR